MKKVVNLEDFLEIDHKLAFVYREGNTIYFSGYSAFQHAEFYTITKLLLLQVTYTSDKLKIQKIWIPCNKPIECRIFPQKSKDNPNRLFLFQIGWDGNELVA
jgi:hypothetical protein